jgi:hypothetical protein
MIIYDINTCTHLYCMIHHSCNLNSFRGKLQTALLIRHLCT